MAVLAVLAEHGDAIEADLSLRGIHLWRDLGTADLSWRRLGVLLEYWPPDTAYGRAILGPVATWGVNDYLIAHLIDAVRELIWVSRAAAGEKKPKRPKPLPRPELPGTGAKSNVISAAEWQQRRAEWRERERVRLESLGLNEMGEVSNGN